MKKLREGEVNNTDNSYAKAHSEDNAIAALLKTYRLEKNMGIEDIAQITGMSFVTIKKIENGKECSPYTTKIFAKTLSKEFEHHVQYATCVVCGEIFVPRRKNAKVCSHACGKKHVYQLNNEWRRRMRQEEAAYLKEQQQTLYNSSCNKKDFPSLYEFERLSRIAGMSYGERQKLERLGLLNTG